MNIVVPQQVKDRFSEVEGQVRGQVVALQQRAQSNYAELQKRFDLLPENLQQLWSGVRAKLQLLLDIAPRTELLALQTSVDQLGVELARVAEERDTLRTELQLLIDTKLALAAAPLPVETASAELEAEVAELEAAPVAAPVEQKTEAKPEKPASSGKGKNGNGRRR